MELKQLKCPNCGAMLDVEDGLDTFFCRYCGTKIILDGQSDAAYRAKAEVKGFEHVERTQKAQYDYLEHTQKAQYDYEEKKRKDRNKQENKYWIILLLIFIVGIGLLYVVPKINSVKTNKELEKCASEVQELISKGDYDTALIMADSIRYTGSWSSVYEDDWDERRENLIKMIKEEQQKNNEESSLVVINSDAEEYKDRNYKDVKQELAKLGFTNISEVELEEKAGLFKSKDALHHITINGSDDFEENDVFDKDAEVLIFIYKQ